MRDSWDRRVTVAKPVTSQTGGGFFPFALTVSTIHLAAIFSGGNIILNTVYGLGM